MSDLQTQIKELIISSLMLEDTTVEEIDADEPLFVEGLGLDSIDALELGVAIRRDFGITIESVSEETRAHFYNVRSLTAFVEANRKK